MTTRRDIPCAHSGPRADALVVTLCAGVSLGVWRVCGILEREWSIYERLSPRYRRILLVGEGSAEDHELARELPSACPVAVIANEDGRDRPLFAAGAVERVRAELAGASAAVVKSDQMWGGDLAVEIAAALRCGGIRTGLVARGGYPWSRFIAWEAGADSARACDAAAAEGELCRAADVVVGTTVRMVDDLRWRYGLAAARTLVVPNFLPEAARPDSAARREPGTVLFAGRLEQQKRVDLLIDAVASLGAEKGAAARLTIVGGGSLEQSLRTRAHERGIRVEFVPRLPQSELLARMQRCAVYAQTSAYEGHPKSVLEAMACGAAVVVTDSPGLADVVSAGVDGLVARGEAGAIATALRRVLTDSDLAATLGRAAAEGAASLRLDAVLPLEVRAHEAALERAGEGAAMPPGAVRWSAELLGADEEAAAQAWARSLHGYARRLPPDRRARFCASVETPVYDVIDRGAIETAGGVHPKHHLMRYHDFFVERIRDGERVLDLGCGYGAVARSIVERTGAHVTGMDFGPANLAQAREMIEGESLGSRFHLVAGDITRERARGPNGEDRFDVVILSNVLEHLADRERLLATYAAWYRPRVILIRVPAFDRNWQTAWKAELGVDFRCDPTHETEYTEASLRAELDGAGLRAGELISRWGEYWVSAEVAG